MMRNLIPGRKGFLRDEAGVTMIEYGFIAALIAVVILLAVTSIGTTLQPMFETIGNTLAGIAG